MPFTSDALGWRLTDNVELEDVGLASFLDNAGSIADCPGRFCSVWVFVDDCLVTEIVRQYRP